MENQYSGLGRSGNTISKSQIDSKTIGVLLC